MLPFCCFTNKANIIIGITFTLFISCMSLYLSKLAELKILVSNINVERPLILIFIIIFILSIFSLISYVLFCYLAYKVLIKLFFQKEKEYLQLKNSIFIFVIYGYVLICAWNFSDLIVPYSLNPYFLLPISNIASYFFISGLLYKFVMKKRKLFLISFIITFLIITINSLGEIIK